MEEAIEDGACGGDVPKIQFPTSKNNRAGAAPAGDGLRLQPSFRHLRIFLKAR
jgi:hypothetical protein